MRKVRVYKADFIRFEAEDLCWERKRKDERRRCFLPEELLPEQEVGEHVELGLAACCGLHLHCEGLQARRGSSLTVGGGGNHP